MKKIAMAPGQRRPCYHRPTGRWSGLSPCDNPWIVWWTEAPLKARLRWHLAHPLVRIRELLRVAMWVD